MGIPRLGDDGYIKTTYEGEHLFKLTITSQAVDVTTKTRLWRVAESVGDLIVDLFEPDGGPDKQHSWADYDGDLLVGGKDISEDLVLTGDWESCGGEHNCKGAAFEFVYAGKSKNQDIRNASVHINACNGGNILEDLDDSETDV